MVSRQGDSIHALCSEELPEDYQRELRELLAKHREGALRFVDKKRIDELMGVYRSGLIRKANAWKVAVARGLLDDDLTQQWRDNVEQYRKECDEADCRRLLEDPADGNAAS